MKKKKHARWRWYEILLVGALLGLAVCSTAWLTSYWGQMRAAQQTFEKLAQAVRAAAPQPPLPALPRAGSRKRTLLPVLRRKPNMMKK